MSQAQLHLAPELDRVMPTIQSVFKQYAPNGFHLEFTAGREWFHHCFWSLHHSGNAVDIRTKTLPDHGVGAISQTISHKLQEALDHKYGKKKYTVLYNDQGAHSPHLHVQFNKGGRFSSPGDFSQRGAELA